MHCLNCCKPTVGLFCSLNCATERHALLLEGCNFLGDVTAIMRRDGAALHASATPPVAVQEAASPESSTGAAQGTLLDVHPDSTAA